jgi:hypothetical protein
MSNPADVAKASGFLKFATRIYSFRIPICRPTIDYQASFKSSVGNPEAASFVAILAQTRADMINTLYTVPNAFDLKLKAVDAYLLQVYRLADCMLTQTVQFDRDLAFEWKGAVTDQVDFSKSSDIIFEIMFVLHTKVSSFGILTRIYAPRFVTELFLDRRLSCTALLPRPSWTPTPLPSYLTPPSTCSRRPAS